MNDDFTTRYAIRLPNGELYRRPGVCSIFGVADQGSARVMVFDTKPAAEQFVAAMRREAASIGIEWHATIVQQLCTPFTAGDPTAQFASDVIDWLREQP